MQYAYLGRYFNCEMYAVVERLAYETIGGGSGWNETFVTTNIIQIQLGKKHFLVTSSAPGVTSAARDTLSVNAQAAEKAHTVEGWQIGVFYSPLFRVIMAW